MERINTERADPLIVNEVVPAFVDEESPLSEDFEGKLAKHEEEDDHIHYSHRSAWVRAAVMGAVDGLVSVASLMLGIGGGSDDRKTLMLAGIAGLVGGALSMSVGEYISVASQKDLEEAEIAKEMAMQAKGPEARAHELEELTLIYQSRGVSRGLAEQVARELTAKDVIRAHARDELGIDLDDLANPLEAAGASCIAFAAGAAIPVLAGAFVSNANSRLISIAVCTAIGLAFFGAMGSYLGDAPVVKGGGRVFIGGIIAMAITYGFGVVFGQGGF